MVLVIQVGDILTHLDGVGTIGIGIMVLDGITGGITIIHTAITDGIHPITDGIIHIMDTTTIIITTIIAHVFIPHTLQAEEEHIRQIQQELHREVIQLTEPIQPIDSALVEHLYLLTLEHTIPTIVKLQQEEEATIHTKTTAITDQAAAILEAIVLHQDLTALLLQPPIVQEDHQEEVAAAEEAGDHLEVEEEDKQNNNRTQILSQ